MRFPAWCYTRAKSLSATNFLELSANEIERAVKPWEVESCVLGHDLLVN